MLRCLSHIDYQYKKNKKIYELFAQKIKNIFLSLKDIHLFFVTALLCIGIKKRMRLLRIRMIGLALF
jgi:hypothetical protein